MILVFKIILTKVSCLPHSSETHVSFVHPWEWFRFIFFFPRPHLSLSLLLWDCEAPTNLILLLHVFNMLINEGLLDIMRIYFYSATETVLQYIDWTWQFVWLSCFLNACLCCLCLMFPDMFRPCLYLSLLSCVCLCVCFSIHVVCVFAFVCAYGCVCFSSLRCLRH